MNVNCEFSTEKIAESKADNIAKIEPSAWLNSKRKIRYSPPITTSPRKTSIGATLRLLNIGSTKLVQKVVVAIPA